MEVTNRRVPKTILDQVSRHSIIPGTHHCPVHSRSIEGLVLLTPHKSVHSVPSLQSTHSSLPSYTSVIETSGSVLR